MEQEYIEVKERIIKTKYGSEKTTTIMARSSEMTEKFKDMLWDDYYLDVDELMKSDINGNYD